VGHCGNLPQNAAMTWLKFYRRLLRKTALSWDINTLQLGRSGLNLFSPKSSLVFPPPSPHFTHKMPIQQVMACLA